MTALLVLPLARPAVIREGVNRLARTAAAGFNGQMRREEEISRSQTLCPTGRRHAHQFPQVLMLQEDALCPFLGARLNRESPRKNDYYR